MTVDIDYSLLLPTDEDRKGRKRERERRKRKRRKPNNNQRNEKKIINKYLVNLGKVVHNRVPGS